MQKKPLKIGKYTLVKLVAKGGMAEIYHAKAKGASNFEKHVALKRILPSYSQEQHFRTLFEQEARVSLQLTHPNVMQTYGFQELGSTYILEMEYIHGKNLRQITNALAELGTIMPVETAVLIMREICKGLHYAHTLKDRTTDEPLQIIHRDLSPQNMMVSFDGEVKIVDFGIAKAKSESKQANDGMIVGKFAYMSPEQSNGAAIDVRSDLFSAGITLWELLTGLRLFTGNNDLSILKEVREKLIPRPSELNPYVTTELDAIVMKMLERDLSKRFTSAKELERALSLFLNRKFPESSTEDLKTYLAQIFPAEVPLVDAKTSEFHLFPNFGDVFYEASESSITNFKEKELVIPEQHALAFSPPLRTISTLGLLVAFLAFFGGSRPLSKVSQPLTGTLNYEVQAGLGDKKDLNSWDSPNSAIVKLRVNHDMELFLGKNKVAMAKAGVPVVITLEGGKKHTLRFLNRSLNINSQRRLLVRQGVVNNFDVNVN